MRMRRRNQTGKVPILLTPLIDCVFLLLIFFLVTGMLKRYERLIPITLADASAAVKMDVAEDVFQFAMNQDGSLSVEVGRGGWGAIEFAPIDDLASFFRDFVSEHGAHHPIQVRVEPGTPFQAVIHVQDMLESHQFQNFRFRIADRGELVE